MTSGQQDTPPIDPHTDPIADAPANPVANRYDPAIADAIAKRLLRRDIDTGDLAELRRMNPLQPTAPLFWNLIFAYRITSPDNPANDDARIERAWGYIISTIAHGTRAGSDGHTGPHNQSIPLGSALARADFHEKRLNALLSANPAQVPKLTLQAAHLLHAQRQDYNCADLARLMLSPLRSQAQREADRTHLARNYHRIRYNLQQQE